MAFPNGRFVWFEHYSKDPQQASGFYGELFGWKTEDLPSATGEPYKIFMLGEHRLGGFVTTPKGAPAHGHWLPLLQVEDVKASAEKIRALGGKVRSEPVKEESGTWCVVADPTDATFILWQPTKVGDGDYKNQPGAFCWVELGTSEPEKAVAFYTAVGGFVDDPMKSDMGTYHVLKSGDQGRAGISAQMNPQEQRSAWMPYVHVTSADQSSDKAKRLGATIALPPTDIPNIGRFSIIVDPQGASLGLLQPAPM